MGSKPKNIVVMSTKTKGDLPECRIELPGLQQAWDTM